MSVERKEEVKMKKIPEEYLICVHLKSAIDLSSLPL